MKLVFLGPPGVGKGTYASRIGPMLGVPHISTGDLLRSEMKSNSLLGNKAAVFIGKGQLVPDEIVIGMLFRRIKEPDSKKGFILDGFPRTIPQAEALEKGVKIDRVVNILLKDEFLTEKISARRQCKNCGEIYNLADINREGIHMPPLLPKKQGICDKCGGALFQRDDDKAETVIQRLGIYRKQTAPLIDFYRNKKLLVDVRVIGGPDVMVPLILKAINS